MKTKTLALFLIPYTLYLYSCSADREKEGTTPINENVVSVDTSLNGLTGVLEKNPPVLNGDYITKYPNGIIKMKGFYINGKREGEWIGFFESGKKQSEGFFKAGLRDGKALVYHENEQIYYEGYYKNGKQVGKWIFFDPQGKKVNEKDYGDKPNS